MRKFYSLTCLLLLLSGLALATKLRNVDDASQDPAQYSQKWLDVISKFEQTTSGQLAIFRERFHKAEQEKKISEKCREALGMFFGRPFGQEWSVKMWDATGHFPSGILHGSFFSPGDYDQCLSITTSKYGSGKYCILEVKSPKPMRLVNLTESGEYSHLASAVNYFTSMDNFAGVANGICVPSVCDDSEIDALIPQVFFPPDTNFRVRTQLCQDKTLQDEPMGFGQKLVFYILLTHAVLALVGTLISQLPVLGQSSNLLLRTLMCFSVFENTRMLFHISKPSAKALSNHGQTQLKFIHGMRVFSIYWVLCAHVFLFYPMLQFEQRVSPVGSIENRHSVIRSLLAHFIVNAGLAVETFFVISGALTIYSVLSHYHRGTTINPITYIALRWLRFAPPTLGTICFLLLWPRLGSGPLFHPQLTSYLTDGCYRNWWSAFAFVSNLLPHTDTCNVMSWYLSADFQLHILLYVVLYFIYRARPVAYVYIALMMLLGFVAPIIIVLAGISEAPNPSIFLHPTHQFPMEKVDLFIFATYNHLTPYFLGAILGLLLLRKQPLQVRPVTCWLLWLIVFPLAMLLPFGSYQMIDTSEPVHDPLGSAITFGIVRLIWSSAMFWLILQCAQGRAGFIRRVLSANCLQPLSRLSFAIYLAHVLSIYHYMYTIRTPITVTLDSLLYLCMSHAVMGTLLAYVLYALFEAPYVNLTKLLLAPLLAGRRKRSSSSSIDAGKHNNNDADADDHRIEDSAHQAETRLELNKMHV